MRFYPPTTEIWPLRTHRLHIATLIWVGNWVLDSKTDHECPRQSHCVVGASYPWLNFSFSVTPALRMGCPGSDPVHCISHSGFTNAAAAKPPAFALNQHHSEPTRVCGRACATFTAVFYPDWNRKCSSLQNLVGEKPLSSVLLLITLHLDVKFRACESFRCSALHSNIR